MIADFGERIKMRIAMIGVKGIAASSVQGGGIERHVEMLAERLAARGHRVTVYVRPYGNPERRKTWSGVRLVTIPTLRNKYLDTILYTFLATLRVLTAKADVIHYHGVGPSTLSWIPRLLKPYARVFVTFHSRDRYHEKWGLFARAFLAFGEWSACNFPHRTIAVSHGIELFCKQMYGRDAIYIPNGVEIPKGETGTSYLKELELEPNEYVMTLGRLIPIKAHEDAIKAFREIDTKKKLLIVGEPSMYDTPYHLMLEQLAAKDPRVVLMGFRGGEELKQLLAHCYCMIHPSRIEGLSVAILEAMSYGKLIVMSDIPANRELVDHSGIAFPQGNISKLRDALQWVLSDPILVKIRGERAREIVKKLYSWDRIIRRIEAEYASAFENT
ncbi:MAG: glycosyltransferase family 4 protein [Patescibacteria group bacterium]|jgi:glycosyltransferase involved in cell wall biosynthesis